ncbi:hypothetical protein PIB30_079431 [Stylosanthes scabra]|uniref:Uncharacterized protein n=1 Tax=Stylosanthes scabra TaxID=79078 RepID=A0ABU6RR41_9FABA|nr:hypothetical protein [Stylosanthes scabra]
MGKQTLSLRLHHSQSFGWWHKSHQSLQMLNRVLTWHPMESRKQIYQTRFQFKIFIQLWKSNRLTFQSHTCSAHLFQSNPGKVSHGKATAPFDGRPAVALVTGPELLNFQNRSYRRRGIQTNCEIDSGVSSTRKVSQSLQPIKNTEY